MKYTRIFLFASPLLLFIPPLIPVSENAGWLVFSSYYGLILRRFPWNLVMAGLCYSYARQIGGDGAIWAGFSFFFPFLTPLVLAFRTPKFNSTADVIQRLKAGPAKAKAASGSFAERFPLLARQLEGEPESAWAEHKQRLENVQANYEFLLALDLNNRMRMMAEASNRNFTTWMESGETHARFYGAGLVEAKDLDDTAKWLKRGAVTGGKLSIMWRQPDGVVKSLDYYAV
jgi:hypothetical protein